MPLDVLKLHQLAVIIRCKSFSRAAEQLGISQSALSKSVKSLERSLGVKLLDRGRFGALPTPFGLALARHADAVEAELRTADSEIVALKTARHGHVCVGCGPSRRHGCSRSPSEGCGNGRRESAQPCCTD